jgi:predicted nucleotidyltransferase
MKLRRAQDPFRTVTERFNQQGVRYVVVGMAGINYYAKNPAELFGTLDYDIFLDPRLSNVEKALRSVRELGFTIGTSSGLFKSGMITEIVRDRKTLIATTTEGIMIELLLQVSGYPFSELARDATTVTVDGVPIKVGKLSKLIESKRLAGREKDKAFLKRYQLLLKSKGK